MHFYSRQCKQLREAWPFIDYTIINSLNNAHGSTAALEIVQAFAEQNCDLIAHLVPDADCRRIFEAFLMLRGLEGLSMLLRGAISTEYLLALE